MHRPSPLWLLVLGGLGLFAACRPAPTKEPTPTPRTAPATRPSGDLPSSPPPVEVAHVLAQVSDAELARTVADLAAFGTRHTLSATSDPRRGIGAARAYLAGRMREFSRQAGDRLQVTLETHAIAPDGRRIDVPVDVVNVVATLPGSMPAATSRHYYVIGHYDSRASDPMDRESDAPGANDDGSGVALVVELARVMAGTKLDATVVFMATAGEEQGLLGAEAHAAAAETSGVDVRAVLSNDIVGDPTTRSHGLVDGKVRVFSESLPSWLLDERLNEIRTLSATSDGPSRQLARFVESIGRWHGLGVQAALVFRRDRFLRGGDHTAFNRHGFSAVRFSEVEENYDHQHQDVRTEAGRAFGDLPTYVDPVYLAGVTRLNGAALIHLANAPSQPTAVRVITASLQHDTTLKWSPAPEPDVAGYELLWRATTDPVWTHAQDVGDVTEITVTRSKDNYFFGVRAYDTAGYRSPVSFAGAAKA